MAGAPGRHLSLRASSAELRRGPAPIGQSPKGVATRLATFESSRFVDVASIKTLDAFELSARSAVGVGRPTEEQLQAALTFVVNARESVSLSGGRRRTVEEGSASVGSPEAAGEE